MQQQKLPSIHLLLSETSGIEYILVLIPDCMTEKYNKSKSLKEYDKVKIFGNYNNASKFHP
jgi:hypothetical protein